MKYEYLSKVLKKKYFQVFKKKALYLYKGLKIGLCIKYFQVFF
jgi:hypothetical protein